MNEPRLERVGDCPPAFWRFLYTEVGRKYHWFDRLPWTDEQIRQYLDDEAVTLYVMWVEGAPAGYFELRMTAIGQWRSSTSVFSIDFTGRGLGGYMLGEAVKLAWAQGALARVAAHEHARPSRGASELSEARLSVAGTQVYEVEEGKSFERTVRETGDCPLD